MARKRPAESNAEAEGSTPAKKQRQGFRVGPDNLPDGPWRRKLTKIKKGLIEKAKVKKAYAKLKAREEAGRAPTVAATVPTGEEDDDGSLAEGAAAAAEGEGKAAPMHPERMAMLEDEDDGPAPRDDGRRPPGDEGPRRRRPQRPDYFHKQLEQAERRRQEAEAREAARQRREDDRVRKLAERERRRKTMEKARAGGRDGRPKLGREGVLLLERARKVMKK